MGTEFLDKTGLTHLWEQITGKISGYIPTTQKNVAGGVAGLDNSGNIPSGLFSTIPIDKGGTGATSASTALTNLGAAAANHTHNDYLPLAGGNMTGYISWGNSPNAGLEWITDNGTRIHLRPYSPANTFQLTLKPSDGDEFGAVNIDTNGNISLAQDLTIANGGTGASDAETARSNLGAAAANHTHDYLSLSGGTITGDTTVQGAFYVSNNNSAAGYVKMWEDNEGGNIAIGSPSGKEFQMDVYNDTTLRCYGYTDKGNIMGVSFNRTNGNLSADGGFYGTDFTATRTTGDAYFTAKRTDTENDIRFGIGSSGENRGIYDIRLNRWVFKVTNSGVDLSAMGILYSSTQPSAPWMGAIWLKPV